MDAPANDQVAAMPTMARAAASLAQQAAVAIMRDDLESARTLMKTADGYLTSLLYEQRAKGDPAT